MEANLEAILSQKAGGMASLRIAWENAILYLGDSGVSDSDQLYFCRSMSSPAAILALADGISSDDSLAQDSSLKDLLLSFSDESPFSVDQWVEAIEKLLLRLRNDSRRATFSRILGYIACAGEFGASHLESTPLPALVLQMYDHYGLEDRHN